MMGVVKDRVRRRNECGMGRKVGRTKGRREQEQEKEWAGKGDGKRGRGGRGSGRLNVGDGGRKAAA